jgi:hypothetical protein
MSRKVTDLSMITPHVSTFDTSQKRIYNMLENDAYQRFLQWHIYLQLVRGDESDDVVDAGDDNDEAKVDEIRQVDESGSYNVTTL